MCGPKKWVRAAFFGGFFANFAAVMDFFPSWFNIMHKNFREMKQTIVAGFLSLAACGLQAQEKEWPVGGADERTPFKAEYFSWINNTNEGATDEQTHINLDFFGWLKEAYGMQLDIYAFDAGAVDGAKMYGSTGSARFRRQFPQGFAPLSRKAADIGIHFGLWGGPDGFGTTEQETRDREEMMVGLVKDYGFRLFKMDAVCGPLRPEKYDVFDRMMTRVRQIAPDLILLNHRLYLGDATRHSTTYLPGGRCALRALLALSALPE